MRFRMGLALPLVLESNVPEWGGRWLVNEPRPAHHPAEEHQKNRHVKRTG